MIAHKLSFTASAWFKTAFLHFFIVVKSPISNACSALEVCYENALVVLWHPVCGLCCRQAVVFFQYLMRYSGPI